MMTDEEFVQEVKTAVSKLRSLNEEAKQRGIACYLSYGDEPSQLYGRVFPLGNLDFSYASKRF